MIKDALILMEIDNLILNNYWRKYYTYKEIGWDAGSIQKYLQNKENMMKIATFNTPTVNFSASSHRNRYYSIFNRLSMLDQDVIWDAITANLLNKLLEDYKIYIISSRKENLKTKTLEIFTKLNINIEKFEFFFLPKNKALSVFRNKYVKEIVDKHPSGVGICLDPSFGTVFKKYNYKSIGFTSIKNAWEISPYCDNICNNWKEIGTILKKMSEHKKKIEEGKKEDNKINIGKNNEENKENKEKIEKKKKNQSALEKAIRQQFFFENNHINGKNNFEQVEIEGTEELIKDFIKELKEKIPLIIGDEISLFFFYFERKFKIDLKNIQKQITNNLNELDTNKSASFMKIYILLSKLLEYVRKYAFEHLGTQQIEQNYRAIANKNLTPVANDTLKGMIESNDKSIMLLSSLALLKWLEKFYPNEKLEKLLSKKLMEQSNKIIVKLFVKK